MAVRRADILRTVRIVAGLAVWIASTCMLVSYGMTDPAWAAWIARIQFFQAAVAFSLSTVILWLLATLVFGRIYCSVACPLGVFQDVCARLMRLTQRARLKRQYHYRPSLTRCRNVCLTIVVVAVMLGLSVVIALTDPWCIYSRACAYIVRPIWGFIVNLFAQPPVRIAFASVLGSIVALVSIVIIGVLAARNGRTFCNSVCPVGTTLGYVSRYSIFHIDINTDKCTQCRKCEHVCKASCIDLTSHVVDSSRCVGCFDCLPVCPDDAIRYTWERHQLAIPMMQKIQSPFAQGAQCMQDCGEFMVSAQHGSDAGSDEKDGVGKMADTHKQDKKINKKKDIKDATIS